MNKHHRDCKWSSKADIRCDDGRLRTIVWQKCRKEDARAYIQQYKTPRGEGDEIEGEKEPPAQTEQAAPPQQEEQPQGPQQGDDAAAGPSSTQAPAAAEEAQQSVPQQHTYYSGGGNTVPDPFGPPVSGSTAPPPSQEYVPSTQGIPRAQGGRYSQGPGYPQSTGYYQSTYYAGDYGGHSSAGEYGGGYDMPFPEDMAFDEYYGGGEDTFSGMPTGGEGGPVAPSTVAAPVEARAEWVATSPENLYRSEETDGVVKDQPYKALPPIWRDTHYAKF